MEAFKSGVEAMPLMGKESIDAIQSFVSIVKDTGDSPDMNDNGTLMAPPSTPTEVEGSESVGLQSAEKDDASKDVPTKGDPVYNTFPRFKVTWDVSGQIKSGHGVGSGSGPIKHNEMSPEATLVEFISTSASFFNVKRLPIKSLEWDMLKVFPNNVMPANAGAWYMAKRRFFLDKPYALQLLPYILTHYPKKFLVDQKTHTVQFLEIYNKEVAKKKLNYLVHQGLFAYFSHKADEYGVYFFDPMYYETTEPFHANLRLVTNCHNTHRSKLIHSYFSKFKSQFHFTRHSPFLVSISKTKTDQLTNTFGVVHSMINNLYGIIHFRNGTSTEKALFCAKSLYKDGFVFERDPMKMPEIQFDGYKVPGNPKAEGKEYTWYAVLVWSGRKPSPKYNSTRDTLASTQFFQNHPVTYEQLAMMANPPQEKFGPQPVASQDQKLDDCMRVGEVVQILRNGAVVIMHKHSGLKALIPGWAHKVSRQRESFLTTTQGVTLAKDDLVAFYMDPKLKAAPYYGVGCNVMVLKHAVSGNQAAKAGDEEKSKKSRSKKEKKTKTDEETSATSSSGEKADSKSSKGRRKERPAKGRRRSTRVSSMASESSADGASRRRTRSERSNKAGFKEFLLTEEVAEADAYDSDKDPSFVPPPVYETDRDFDEYSDDEIKEDEPKTLVSESSKEIEINLPVEKPESDGTSDGGEAGIAKKEAKWKKFLLNGEPDEVATEEDDRDYVPPVGLDLHMEEKRIKDIPIKIAEASQLVDKLKIEPDIANGLKKLAAECDFAELFDRIVEIGDPKDDEFAKIKEAMADLSTKMQKLKIPVVSTSTSEEAEKSGEDSEPEIGEEEIEELLLDAQQILEEFGAGAKEAGEKGYHLRPLREENPEV